MGSINFDQETKKEIVKTLNIFIKELRDVLEANGQASINFRCPNLLGLGNDLYHNDWYLKISKHKVKLYNNYNHYNGSGVGPFRLDLIAKNINVSPLSYTAAYVVISKYEQIKEELIEKINKDQKTKNNILENLKEFQQRHTTDVEIDFGECMNKPKIVIIDDAHKKIGTINFGSQTIKIITSGDIIVNDATKQKKIGKIN